MLSNEEKEKTLSTNFKHETNSNSFGLFNICLLFVIMLLSIQKMFNEDFEIIIHAIPSILVVLLFVALDEK